MELEIKGVKADKAAGKVSLNQEIFDTAFNESLIHQLVNAYLAGGRAGSKAQKNRSAVKGGGSKPWRQKGTGRARAGTRSSPIWRGGGRAFAALPGRNYQQKINRKSYKLGMRSILAELHRQDRLLVVDAFNLKAPKTRDLVAELEKLNVSDALIIDTAENPNLELSARNLPFVSVCRSGHVNPVDLISHQHVVLTKQGLDDIQERYS